MRWFLLAVAALHALFMIFELFPWELPVLLRLLSENKKLLKGPAFTEDQRKLVARIVQNAGVYNGIVAGGLFWAAYAGQSATDVARILLIGAAVAGVFGAVTLKSAVPAVQALAGVIGLFIVGFP
jgi:putative membrane protein